MATKVYIDFWLRDEVKNPNFMLGPFVKTLLLFTGINVLVTSIRAFSFTYISMRGTYNTFKNLNKRILSAKMIFFDKTPIGQIINRLSYDTWTIDDHLPWVFHITFEDISRLSAYGVGILIQAPYLILRNIL